MKIAITGATGDIGGSYLAHITKDNTLNVLVRNDSSLTDKPNIEKFLFDDSFNYSTNLLENFTNSQAVVHCAALLNTNGYKLAEMLAVNAFLTASLVMASRKQVKAPHFIYISSEMVYALSGGEELETLVNTFAAFCSDKMNGTSAFNLKQLAADFMEQTKDFPYDKYNHYALTKYLGEKIVQTLELTTVLRISSAYGPEYTNPRLIPRMLKGRLTGHDVVFTNEKRDFVYSQDINNLINAVISEKHFGVIDCKSSESISTSRLASIITEATPTAYGKLIASNEVAEKENGPISKADSNLRDFVTNVTSFTDGLAATIRRHKEHGYHQMKDSRSIEDFLEPGESVVRKLKGSSAAHLYITAKADGRYVVRKIAIYDGVEGNGIAKVANEMNYYRYLKEDEPGLATMYAKLLDSKLGDTFSSITIEYLRGKNFYEAIKSEQLSYETYERSYKDYLDKLCANVLPNTVVSMNPENDLDVYYVERAATRLHAIREIIEVKDKITINNEVLLSPHVILTDLLSNKELRQHLLPQLESICFHGDMTLLNNVFLDETHQIKMIDPRGYIGSWEPLYDFAKLQFTLSGFGEFVVGKKPMITGKDNDYTIHFENIPQFAKKLHENFFDILEENEVFKKYVISHEPHWRERIAFAEATHFLADIPFRLYTDETPLNALSSYILGTYYLNQVYKVLKNEKDSR